MAFIPDNIGYIAGMLTTVSFLPQAVLTLKTRKTDTLSFGMYGLFTLGLCFWLWYGLVKTDPAIILANAITLALATPILIIKLINMARGE